MKNDYRSYVGPPETYDLMGAVQFNLLTFLGLREHHYLLDIGCGSLRAGRLFIPYLLPRKYCGIEPEGWLIEDGIDNELGKDALLIKRPDFSGDDNFNFSTFEIIFDFLLAQSIFTHIPEELIRRCLSEAKKVMRKESIFVASYLKGEEDKEHYPGGYTWTEKTMRGMVEEAGFYYHKIIWPHPNDLSWIMISFKEERVIRFGGEGIMPPTGDIVWRELNDIQ